MKITDLQVNDWVRIIEPDPHHGYIAKVRCIGGTNNYLTVYMPHQHNKDVFIEDVEPIELTADILRSNDFENDNDNYVLWYNDGTDSVEVELKDKNYTNGSYTFVNVNRGCVSIFELPVQYVHELQHVLKMCEIDVDINPMED